MVEKNWSTKFSILVFLVFFNYRWTKCSAFHLQGETDLLLCNTAHLASFVDMAACNNNNKKRGRKWLKFLWFVKFRTAQVQTIGVGPVFGSILHHSQSLDIGTRFLGTIITWAKNDLNSLIQLIDGWTFSITSALFSEPFWRRKSFFYHLSKTIAKWVSIVIESLILSQAPQKSNKHHIVCMT